MINPRALSLLNSLRVLFSSGSFISSPFFSAILSPTVSWIQSHCIVDSVPLYRGFSPSVSWIQSQCIVDSVPLYRGFSPSVSWIQSQCIVDSVPVYRGLSPTVSWIQSQCIVDSVPVYRGLSPSVSWIKNWNIGLPALLAMNIARVLHGLRWWRRRWWATWLCSPQSNAIRCPSVVCHYEAR